MIYIDALIRRINILKLSNSDEGAYNEPKRDTESALQLVEARYPGSCLPDGEGHVHYIVSRAENYCK